MIKVMIVDDERLIREGLSSLIDWEAQGFQVCALARDGFDALAHFDREYPQVVITDIRMPGMDGLELVESLRRQDPWLHVLILSGFAEFEYAKRAMASRVDGYLLKPVDEAELAQHLVLIRQEIAKRKTVVDTPDELARRREEVLQILASGLASGATLQQLPACDLSWTQYQVLLIEPLQSAGTGGDAVMLTLQILRSAIDERRIGPVFPHGRWLGILLRQAWTKPAALEQLHREITRALQPRGIFFDIAVAPPVPLATEIADSCRTAELLLGQGFFAPQGAIITVDTLGGFPRQPAASPGSPGQAWNLPARIERLSYALDTRNQDALAKALDETVAAMRALGLGEADLKSGFAGLAGALTERYLQLHPASEDARESLGDWVAGIYRQVRLDALVAFMRQRMDELWQRENPASAESIVERMKDLIERHSADNLRLETLAEAFGYNSAYLGKLFKARTGEYFNAWLDGVRIRKAKALLERGIKVYQVAQIVGYADADYFQAKFKKLAGVTPSAWRLEKGKGSAEAGEGPHSSK